MNKGIFWPEEEPIIYTRIIQWTKGFFGLRKNLPYIQGSFNEQRYFLAWGRTYHIYKDHSMNKGIFWPEEEPTIYTRIIQWTKVFFGLRKNLLYIQGSFNEQRYFLAWGRTYHIYKDHSMNKGIFWPQDGPIIYSGVIQWSKVFFGLRKDLLYIQGSVNKQRYFLAWGRTYYIYEYHSMNEGIFWPEEEPIIYTRIIQWTKGSFGLKTDLLYIWVSFNDQRYFLAWGRICYIYKGQSINKGIFWPEEGSVIYTRVNQ